MNKLEGFTALRNCGLPSVPWREYKRGAELDSNILWSIRSAAAKGDDLNLPRKIGVTAEEAKEFAEELLNKLNANDLVLFYPYFIAVKSGVIEVSDTRVVIEAVKEDLWNLVTYNNRDVTVLFEQDNLRFVGDSDFLTQTELYELIDSCARIKKTFSQEIAWGKSIMLEWSFACKSDLNKRRLGEQSLVFYEIRTV